MATLMRKEPSATTGVTLGAFIAAVVGILKLYGVDIPEQVADNVEIIVTGLISLPVISGFIIRYLVVSPQTAAEKVVEAALQDPAVPVPNIKVPGYKAAVKEQLPTAPPPVVKPKQ